MAHSDRIVDKSAKFCVLQPLYARIPVRRVAFLYTNDPVALVEASENCSLPQNTCRDHEERTESNGRGTRLQYFDSIS